MSTPLEFWDTVRLECGRADRYEMRLSMVVYEIGIKDEKNVLVRTLVRRLSRRVRNMDFIGWFGPGQIGVLMPHTPNDGATRLAQDVYDLLLPFTSPPPFTVYTYPSNLWPIKKSVPLRLIRILKNLQSMINQPSIASSEELKALVALEMDRANRYGHTFALLVFHCRIVKEKGIALFRLARALNNRLRETDTFGWFGQNDIAIILPHSDYPSAERVGKELCQIMEIPANGCFTAYAYPNQWMNADHTISAPAFPRETSEGRKHPLPLLGKDEFAATLNNEIAQVTQDGHFLSLIVFKTKEIAEKGGATNDFVKSIDRRLSSLNRLGWCEDGAIGVVLPYTTYEEAFKLGYSLCVANQLAAEDVMAVYAYPTCWLPNQPSVSPPGSPPEPRHSFNGGEKRNSASHPIAPELDEYLAQSIPVWKRALDIVGALCGIALFAPLFVVAAIGIKMSSPGPIIFRQTRIGYKRRPFKILKFRSMHVHADAEKHRKFMKELISTRKDSPNTKMKNDERIFPFAVFLRKASIDELPQLFNVLKGDMSLVGPRPCLDYEADEYLQWHTRRFYIMPGVTGLWQVSGKNRLSFEQMIRLDILYAKNISLWMDLKIIFKTFPALISIYFEK